MKVMFVSIIVIGTSHQKLSPGYKKELLGLLSAINPDQILLEKQPIELSSGEFKPNRPEMELAFRWARANNKRVAGYDRNSNILRKSVSKPKLAAANKELSALTKRYGWRELNEPRYWGQLNDILEPVLDAHKHKQREKRMLEAIQRKMIKNGRVLILTGSYHLPFFRKELVKTSSLSDV